jgi:hypothetical protein
MLFGYVNCFADPSGRTRARIASSIPAGGLDICLLLALSGGEGSLRQADHSSTLVLPNIVYN